MSKVTAGLVCLLALPLGGCWEFLEPEFAEQDAATVLQVNARINERGDFNLNALLVPGLDEDGFVRAVPRDTLYVLGMPFESDSSRRTGSRFYSASIRVSPQLLAQPFTIDPPVVQGIATGPRVRWPSPRPLEPDTIRIARGSDLLIRIAYDSARANPPPVHQWFLELTNNFDRFQIGANGPPPTQLLVPAMWIPTPRDSVIHVLFSSFQSAQIFQNDYRGVYGYTVQFDHTIVIR